MAQNNRAEEIAEALGPQEFEIEDLVLVDLVAKLTPLPEDIRTDEGFPKWFLEIADTISNTNIYSILSSLHNTKFEAISDDNYFELNFTAFFGSAANLTMVNILRGLEDRALQGIAILERWLEQIRRRLGQNEVEIDRLGGATFVVESLRFLVKIQFEIENQEQLLRSWGRLQRFDGLSAQAKGFAYFMQLIFIGEFKNTYDDEVRVADKAIDQDPGHWEWHLGKLKVLRWERRSRDIRGVPLETELDEVRILNQLNPTHPFCVLRTCQFLAELLKSAPPEFPFQLADNIFENNIGIVEFIRKKAEGFEIADESKLVEFAKIFSSDLPTRYRDRVIAERFLQRALDACPTRSRTNHRMGVFLIQGRQYDRALEFLSRAVELAPYRNLTARLELIRVLMRDCNTNLDRLRDLFELEMQPQNESASVLMQVMFLRGYYHFKVGEFDEALTTWMNTNVTYGDSFIFEDHLNNFLDATNGRYLGRYSGWPRTNVRSELMSIQRRVFQNRPIEAELAVSFDRLIAAIAASLAQAQAPPMYRQPRPPRPNQPAGIDRNWRRQ